MPVSREFNPGLDNLEGGGRERQLGGDLWLIHVDPETNAVL